jgi:hypothetical protein
MNAVSADFAYDRTLAPVVLLFGDDARRRKRLKEAITASGGRLAGSGPLTDARDRLERQASAAHVVLDLHEDSGGALDTLLERLDRYAIAMGRLSVLVLAPPALIDVVTARIADPGVAILIDPTARELDAALAVLLAPLPRHVAEGVGGEEERPFVGLGEEVEEINRALETIAIEEGAVAAAPPERTTVSASDGQLVRAILRLRRLRGQHFLPSLFADPAWDILLDLTSARIERRKVAASSLCIAAAVPATTALRWIAQMTEHKLLVREPDPHDGRRVFILLTEKAAAMMEAYLATARRIVSPVS